MKKVLSLFIVVIMITALASCGNPESEKDTATPSSGEKVSSTESNTIAPTEEATELQTEEPTDLPPATQIDEETISDDDDESAEADWKNLYTDRINDSSLNSNDKSYALADIDGDGIPELVIDSIQHMTGKFLYWVDDGTLCNERIDLSWGDFRYNSDQKLFWSLSNAQGAGYTLFSFENGSLTQLHSACFTTTGTPTYDVDGQETDKETYDAMVEEITSQCSDTVVFYESKTDILDAISQY